jgi:hypothetical protein
VLVQRLGAFACKLESVFRRIEARDHAELVAAHPERAGLCDAAGQVLRKPLEQRVAGGVSESVVVELETVQVVEREQQRATRARAGE